MVVAREELEGSVVLAEDVVEEACSGGEEEAKPVHVVMSAPVSLARSEGGDDEVEVRQAAGEEGGGEEEETSEGELTR